MYAVYLQKFKFKYGRQQLCRQSIKRFIYNHNLPIRLVLIPGKKLRDLFCSSRPYDQRKCTISNCKICPNLVGSHCAIKNPIYKVICNLCKQFYVGESNRTAHDRLSEHLRFAKNPDCAALKHGHVTCPCQSQRSSAVTHSRDMSQPITALKHGHVTCSSQSKHSNTVT